MNITEIIIIASLVLALTIAALFLLLLKIRNRRLILTVAQLIVDKNAIADELDKVSFLSNNSIDVENGFIKFLSQSRESAFQYIEDVQKNISELQGAVESGDDDRIDASYNKLISLMPSGSPDSLS
jgi:hypothetical protein